MEVKKNCMFYDAAKKRLQSIERALLFKRKLQIF